MPDFVEVYRPAAMHELVTIKSLLEGTDIGYYIHNENFLHVVAPSMFGTAGGYREARLMVESGKAEEVAKLLKTFGFGGEESEEP